MAIDDYGQKTGDCCPGVVDKPVLPAQLAGGLQLWQVTFDKVADVVRARAPVAQDLKSVYRMR
ncbi:MAG: hypothetical protein AAF674_22400 [Pseudomonadota bacterium]